MQHHRRNIPVVVYIAFDKSEIGMLNNMFPGTGQKVIYCHNKIITRIYQRVGQRTRYKACPPGDQYIFHTRNLKLNINQIAS